MNWALAVKAPDWRSIWSSARARAPREPFDLSAYAQHPIAFIFRYLRRRAVSHGAILAAVVIAVGCSVATHGGMTFQTNIFSMEKMALEVAVMRLVSMPGKRSAK